MRIIETVGQMKLFGETVRKEGLRAGFVPTMGYLHKGHISLVERSRAENDVTVVSIFVNPTQFGPGEDLDKYPRDFDRDKELCEAAGVDAIFFPTPEIMYPKGHQTKVHVEDLANPLCGEKRPGHFDGVCTVVLKLFNIVMPHVAYFGQKDYQQLKVIERMVLDLDVNVHVVGCPIVREADGLAMSSRNRYLSEDERVRALALSRSLEIAEGMVASGERDAGRLTEKITGLMEEAGMRVDYAEVRDPDTLEIQGVFSSEVLIALAGFLGDTRLIDNRVIKVG